MKRPVISIFTMLISGTLLLQPSHASDLESFESLEERDPHTSPKLSSPRELRGTKRRNSFPLDSPEAKRRIPPHVLKNILDEPLPPEVSIAQPPIPKPLSNINYTSIPEEASIKQPWINKTPLQVINEENNI